MHIKAIKEVLSRVINKYFQFSNKVKTVVPLSYQRINIKIILYMLLCGLSYCNA